MMEYVVGSVADLVAGNLTPSRPAAVRRPLTPVKHQPSPRVTPRGDGVPGGRDALLSPSVLRKKAVVKKSPKRIFESEDLDKTADGDVLRSPKADKVKKHLQAELDSSDLGKINEKIKTPKRRLVTEAEVDDSAAVDNSDKVKTLKRKLEPENLVHSNKNKTQQDEDTESVSKKKTKRNKKKKKNNIDGKESTQSTDKVDENIAKDKVTEVVSKSKKRRNKKKKKNTILGDATKSNENLETAKVKVDNVVDLNENAVQNKSKDTKTLPNKKKNKKSNLGAVKTIDNSVDRSNSRSEVELLDNVVSDKVSTKNDKRNKQKNNKKNKKHEVENGDENKQLKTETNIQDENDSDSEHDSDNEIESETEQDVKQILDSGPVEDENSSDEEEKEKQKKPKSKPQKEKKKKDVKEKPVNSEEESKRTLFVGNVPISKKVKKDIKQIFLKYGAIESVRIRTVPVKDLRTSPKVALITNEIHPERSSVNVYVKFADESSVTKALSENNRLMGEHHLRVTRGEATSAAHDPRRALFVGNVPFGLEDEALRARFERCGEIESVRIVRDRASQIGKGFGYINFASTDGVELALSLSEEDLTIKNKILRVRRYTQAPPGQKVRPKGPGQRPTSRFDRNDSQGGRPGYQGSRDDRSGWGKGSQSSFNMGTKAPRDESGALKRINNKRKFLENPAAPISGPSQKKHKNLDQPVKEKKSKKEFVGMTAEKKKKKKFNKGQKNKKKLSEILTKS